MYAPMGIINWYYAQAFKRNQKANEEAEADKKRKEEEEKKQKDVKNKNSRVHPAQGRSIGTLPITNIPSQALEELVDELD